MSNYFSVEELRCRCPCDIYNIYQRLLDKLNFTRRTYGKPIIINSGCRCPSHNKRVGGSATSSHITTKNKECKGVDIKFPKSYEDMHTLATYLFLHFRRIGINPKKKFFHVDVDTKKRTPCLYFYK